ncbi:MAG: DMT family transporter [Paracoccaceae bacterium]
MLARLRAERPTVYGAVLIVFAMSVIGFLDNVVRVIAGDIGLWQFHLLRSAIAVPVLWGFASATGIALAPRRWGPVTLRTAFLTASMLLYFAALPMMPIAQAAAGLFTAPIFVLVFSVVLFGLRIGLWRVAAVVFGFAGVVLILRPEHSGFNATFLVPVAAGALYALSTVATRQWCAEEGTSALLFSSFLALGLAGLAGAAVLAAFPAPPGFLERAPFLFSPWGAPGLPVWGLIVLQAFASLAAVAALTRGYQSAETSRITVFEYSFLIMATFWGWMLWGTVPRPSDVIGIAMIIVSGSVIAIRGARAGADEALVPPPAR